RSRDLTKLIRIAACRNNYKKINKKGTNDKNRNEGQKQRSDATLGRRNITTNNSIVSNITMNLFKFLAVTIFMVCFLKDNLNAYPATRGLQLFIEVTLYEAAGFQGASETFQLNPFECFEVPQTWATIVSSVIIKDGYCATFFQETACGGQSVCDCGKIDLFATHRFLNDNMRSISPENVISLEKTCNNPT
ncbi:11541_t:CDS:2, partial [Dentiscutata heterogama]